MAAITIRDQSLLRDRNLSPAASSAPLASPQISNGGVDPLCDLVWASGTAAAAAAGLPKRNENLSVPLALQMLGREQNKAAYLGGAAACPFDGFGAYPASPLSPEAVKVLQNFFLPVGNEAAEDDDEFRIYDFKVRRCTRGKSHDWTECPFAHPGEKARRRDPRRYDYSGTPCADFRKGICRKGDACEFAHGVFECWLHPERYRTQLCKDGKHCKRKVCFFAHTPEQLRYVPAVKKKTHTCEVSFKEALNDGAFPSPTSTLVGYSQSFPSVFASPRSPSMSPDCHSSLLHTFYDHNSSPSSSPSSLICPVPALNSYFQSVQSISAPFSDSAGLISSKDTRSQDLSDLIATIQQLNMGEPITNPNSVPIRSYHFHDATSCLAPNYDAEPYLELVDSGRALRAEIYERLLSKKLQSEAAECPNLDWVSELVN